MSFAATLALVAGYQSGLPWRAAADSSLGARIALWGGRELAGLVLASVVAGLATTLYAAFHFHRLAPYGVIANLAAMPVVSAFVMPMGMLGALAMPFGFDGLCWRAMGLGLDWMVAVALWVTALPGAVGRMAAFGTGPLLLGTLGLVLICLLRTPLRWSGALIAAGAVTLALATPRPDILVAADGQAVAVRGPDGRLAVARAGNDSFAVRDWLAADGDLRAVDDASLGEGVRCDRAGCMLPLADGRRVAFVREIEAFAEDCTRAAVVASPREAQRACAALLIDRKAWRSSGAVALYADGDGFSVVAARPAGANRPWAPVFGPPPARTAPPDATPPADVLRADDQ